jgi:formylglycine-generating enzyme required for sulfatase activity
MKRKQENIFSRIEGIQAPPSPIEFPESPPRKQDDCKKPARLLENAVIEPADNHPTGPPQSPNDEVSGDPAEERQAPEPEPSPAAKDVGISRRTRLGADIFGSFNDSFVLVSPGTFSMGSPEYETGRYGDETLHEVTISKEFYMQKTPVTQGQWKAVMGNNPASFRDEGADLPIECISWNECEEFLRKLNSGKEGKYRLPTEAEWEYACRAGSGTPFGNGEISEVYCGRDAVLWESGWYCGNSDRKSRPVAGKAPNEWGIYDMHGNIAEWCRDWYGDYPSEPRTDPGGPASGPGKVVRGGSWFSNAKNCRSAARFHWPPNRKSDFIGFRLVREVS